MVDQPDRIDKIGLTPAGGGLFTRVLSASGRLKYRLLINLLSRPLGLFALRSLIAVARLFTPVLRLGRAHLTLSHAHTLALLEQADDFHVTAGLSDRLPAGYFLMDIDWEAQHKAEKALIEEGLGDEAREIRQLQAYAGYRCAKYIHENGGRPLNVARDFTEELTLDVVHEYFGIGDDKAATRERLRVIFRLLASQIFQSAPIGGELALETLRAQDDLLRITLNNSDFSRDTVLTRLQKAAAREGADWATEIWAARNAAGLAAFGSGTVARAATQITYRLLSLCGARDAAHDAVWAYLRDPGPDTRNGVRQIAMEALRFNPMLPLMGVRRSTRRSELYALCPHRRVRVDAGETLIPSPFAAMFDRNAFPCPSRFRTEQRQLSNYLHFGEGRHICVGKRVAEALLEEVVISLFRDPRLRRRTPLSGVAYDGPAVERFMVRFDA